MWFKCNKSADHHHRLIQIIVPIDKQVQINNVESNLLLVSKLHHHHPHTVQHLLLQLPTQLDQFKMKTITAKGIVVAAMARVFTHLPLMEIQVKKTIQIQGMT